MNKQLKILYYAYLKPPKHINNTYVYSLMLLIFILLVTVLRLVIWIPLLNKYTKYTIWLEIDVILSHIYFILSSQYSVGKLYCI